MFCILHSHVTVIRAGEEGRAITVNVTYVASGKRTRVMYTPLNPTFI